MKWMIVLALLTGACTKVNDETLPTPERQEELPRPNNPFNQRQKNSP
jgi:hypothetical protein